jgi:hypothetical protein
MLAFVFLPFACGDGDAPSKSEACTQNSDCEGQPLCIEGTCRDEIETTSDGDEGDTTTDPGSDSTSDNDGGDTTFGGDPCELGGNVCLDANTLGECNEADQSTTQVSCDAWCDSMGFSAALGCSVAMDAKHQCYCDQATASCTESTCGGGNVLAECNEGVLAVRDCEGECQAKGLSGECGYDFENASYFCNCTGSFGCVEGTTFCQDSLTEVRCVGGVWQQPQLCSDEACHMEVCLDTPSSCPQDYQAQTLGCGYDSFYGDTGCLCTS